MMLEKGICIPLSESCSFLDINSSTEPKFLKRIPFWHEKVLASLTTDIVLFYFIEISYPNLIP